ncbi:DUF1768 domain-containing protein [Plantactinospora sp. S1510]|uniref:DUF1768 domain-containing protein n=1 Tax=Plantactinospora alkalitolerans TaxID=2789879 RepID=A0ABS0H9N3_9ACTN|nr:NADAR domain-containing protein [Plantactinospora alkalitolerans]MBF9135186.1 DUF1768 domain-containing protein [Plantactinospora alkalitolerans]
MTDEIRGFSGKYRFLSNFFPAPLHWDGLDYPTSEHAFNSGKTTEPFLRQWIASAPDLGEAKRRGHQVRLRDGWEARVRYRVMEEVLRAKFTANDGRIQALLSTGDALLVETNTWNDQVWGDCQCREHRGTPGENHLGRLLMKLRDELRRPAATATATELVDATGDLLAADAEALVNPVNCVGVMGAGLALQFKQRHPEMFEAYRVACQVGQVKPGQMFVHHEPALTGARYVINFPTKRHYRDQSQADDIAAGLLDLTRVVRELGIRSIAIPALGCGLGGLRWAEVRPMIERAFAGMTDVRVLLYGPQSTGAAP